MDKLEQKEPQQKTDRRSAFTQLLDLYFTHRGQGESRCVLEVADHLFNLGNVVHGGAIYTLADTAMGAALYTLLDKDKTCTTIEIKMSYFKPVTSGQLVCQAKVVNTGRKVATMEAEVFNHDRLISKALGTFYILNK